MNPPQLSDVVAAAIGHNSPNIVSLDDDDASDVTASAIIIGSERVIVVGARLSEVAGPSGTSYLMQYLLTAIYLLSASLLSTVLIGFVYCSFSATAASAAADPGGVE